VPPAVPANARAYLALDLGASSGRGVLGTLDADGRMSTREVHRFGTPLVEAAGRLWWDADALWAEVRTALGRALAEAPALRAVSVDSWAVDYVPLGADGRALRPPYAYRDPRTRGRLDEAVRRIPGGADALYARTGTQFLPFNTLPQVVADLADEPALVARTTTRLFVADYLLYRMTGRPVAERTMASTSQLLDARTGAWADDVIRAVGDDPARWPEVVAPGTVLGPVRGAALPAGAHAPLAVATCAHDTAAAVAAVPAAGDRAWAYISSGTWSLVGAELAEPVLTPAARLAGFTNEAGLDGTVRFLKNRTGMWVLEECVRAWSAHAADGRPDWASLFGEAAASAPAGFVIDLDAPAFGERCAMPRAVADACRARGRAAPATRGALVRLVLESLAAGYARTLGELEALTGERAAVVHVVGGGARIALLNQLTADACGRPVAAGPGEATALGNLLVQARAVGDLPPGASVRDAARRSVEPRTYVPAAQPAPLAAAR
jgi:rhamnulokinase